MEADVVAAAVKALGIPGNHTHELGCTQVQLVTSTKNSSGDGRRASSPLASTAFFPSASVVSASSDDMHAAAMSESFSIIRLLFYADGNITDSFLQSATAPAGPYMAFLRNALPAKLFPVSGGGVQQCYNTTSCGGPALVVIQPITSCDADVCFLIDGSGSIANEAWQVELNVVDSIIGAIGRADVQTDMLPTAVAAMLSRSVANAKLLSFFATAGNPSAIVAAMEFSSNQAILIPPTIKSDVDASTLRKFIKESGGTNMASGIEACQSLFKQEPMSSTGRRNVLILLTDGQPDSPSNTAAAADKAKSAGTAIITMGVSGADLVLMSGLSSGPGYSFSADEFNNDAANIGAEIAPVLCHANPDINNGEAFLLVLD
uniref:VWFA domain-containing protein n=1 Tax=Tetradesmus obliquus TaxID=3088 RepID=A0A383VFT5_TETOB|eukprot:jgi/Sobl393_1/3590/SZX63793.1